MGTLKQKALAKSTSEMIGGRKPVTTMKEVLLNAGYSLTTANQQQVVLESQGYLEELQHYVPNEMLTTVGLSGLTAEKINNFTGEVLPDWNAIHKFWRDFHIMKGNLKTNDNTLNVQVNNFSQLTEEQLKELINKVERLNKGE